MNWRVDYLPEAMDDFDHLDNSQRILARKAIAKVSKNPLYSADGGYGKPLGPSGSTNLTGFMKIKLKSCGLRVVYQLVRTEQEMRVIVIGARADDEVYEEAHNRIDRHQLVR